MSMLRLLWGNRKSRIGLVILGAIIVMAIFGPFLVGDPLAFVAKPHQPPSGAYWFGTTGQGQDVFAQTICGARMTLFVGFIVGLLVTFVGALVGIGAGYAGGRTDDALTLLINVFLVIPGLPLAVVLAAWLPPGPGSLIFALAVTGWAWTARVLRAQTLAIRGKDFVKAAVVAGESGLRIVLREILPNMASLMASTFVGTTIYAIGAQVSLEFLGLGDVGAVTWGTNLYWATNDQALLTASWWTFVPTGLGVALVGFALAMINFGIDEVTNPKLGVERRWKLRLKAKGQRPGTSTPVVREDV
jgi:peptide/nickel transport system permease protein